MKFFSNKVGLVQSILIIPIHVFFLSLITFASSSTANELDYPAININLVENIYTPSFINLENRTDELTARLAELCLNPDIDQLTLARLSFANAVSAFSIVEFYRIGPMLEDNHQNRLFYWPDPRRAGERQLRKLLLSDNVADFNVDTVSEKSVALQGFPALERLLFDKSAEAELTGTAVNNQRCKVAFVVATNLFDIATALSQSWQDPNGIRAEIEIPRDQNEYFRTDKEIIRSVLTQATVGIELVASKKLAILLDNDVTQGSVNKLTKAPFNKSNLFLNNVEGNLIGLQSLVNDSGIVTHKQLKRELSFEFLSALQLVGRLKTLPTIKNEHGELNKDAKDIIRALASGMRGFQSTLHYRLASTLGVSAGFNSEDGD